MLLHRPPQSISLLEVVPVTLPHDVPPRGPFPRLDTPPDAEGMPSASRSNSHYPPTHDTVLRGRREDRAASYARKDRGADVTLKLDADAGLTSHRSSCEMHTYPRECRVPAPPWTGAGEAKPLRNCGLPSRRAVREKYARPRWIPVLSSVFMVTLAF
ncbi:hypothetical protein DL768_006974 [Monosporascus sp. mg162]|nr:hypothetical protein DL768_006974 [Monosporascus sp. mg162]